MSMDVWKKYVSHDQGTSQPQSTRVKESPRVCMKQHKVKLYVCESV